MMIEKKQIVFYFNFLFSLNLFLIYSILILSNLTSLLKNTKEHVILHFHLGGCLLILFFLELHIVMEQTPHAMQNKFDAKQARQNKFDLGEIRKFRFRFLVQKLL